MNISEIKQAIEQGRTALGIEMGSTRIKAVLIGPDHAPIASGDHAWENKLENGVWTYSLDDVWTGVRSAYAHMAADVREKYDLPLTNVGALGFSGMMHGYLAFDADGNQLVPFRTWRNTITEEAAAKLTEQFGFNVPQRWSVAHLYQAMLKKEPHVPQIAFLTTLAGYVHWKLTGKKVLGVGEASGMFPIDSKTNDYDARMVSLFDENLKAAGLPFTLREVFPAVLCAGEDAGTLTAEGAALLDPTGTLRPGIPMCPPEGDAGTGMTATNSVAPRTGNVSAGTSIFSMVVLEKALSRVYPEIDMVTTPTGKPVAMVHCNTCTSDLDAWVKLFSELLTAAGASISKPALYDLLYYRALESEPDAGGVVSYNYYSGEPVSQTEEGRPMMMRLPDSAFTLANFMRAQLYATMATLKLGMELLEQENVQVDTLYGHGGLFKTKGVGQRLMAGAMNMPVAVMETAGEGGPWGMALLAAYRTNKADGESLEDYLNAHVFAGAKGDRMLPMAEDVAGFADYMVRYKAGLAAERAAAAVQ